MKLPKPFRALASASLLALAMASAFVGLAGAAALNTTNTGGCALGAIGSATNNCDDGFYCQFGGKNYPSGSQITVLGQTWTCNNGQWKIGFSPLPSGPAVPRPTTNGR